MQLLLRYLALASCSWLIQGFVSSAPRVSCRANRVSTVVPAFSSAKDNDDDGVVIDAEITEKKEIVGNLVADDEWAGVTMELSQLIQKSIEEDLKQKAREFLGKEEYQLGDLSKEIDARVKQGVANIRGKENYEVGDLVLSLDEMSKSLTEDLTGKPYQAGDLSRELDSQIKGAVAKYAGKDTYEAGDLTRAVAANVESRVAELTANYEFGDISREIERQRREWVSGFLGEEVAKNYKFGDITKKLASNITGKDEYQFGDVTKKLLGKEDYQFGDLTKSLLGNVFGKKDKKDKDK